MNSVEIARAQDVDDSVDGTGAFAGTPKTPLIEKFYDTNNPSIFEDYLGDALCDHDDLDIHLIQCRMNMIRIHKQQIADRGDRGDFTRMMESHTAREKAEAELGRYFFDLVDGYMEKASERCA